MSGYGQGFLANASGLAGLVNKTIRPQDIRCKQSFAQQ